MCFEELFRAVSYTGVLPKGEATGITEDSRRVLPGSVFVCIEGRTSDGHKFAKTAVEKGAAVVVCSRPLGIACEVVVQDTRLCYALLCQGFFKNPAEKLKLIAVTGTNGKTTVSTVIKQVFCALGHPCGLIGTAQNEIGELVVPSRYTTPQAWDLAALMHRMVQAGCTHLVMEASSQALDQGRLLGLHFELAVFTNLSKDHLDWHGDMEQYFLAKKELFLHSKAMLVNRDDPYGMRLLQEVQGIEAHSYSCQSDAADFVAHRIKMKMGQVDFGFLAEEQLYPLVFPMPGSYSVYNALAAGGAAVMLLQMPPQDVMRVLGQVQGVPGRCETLYNKEFTVLRDFAHTADGLEQLLMALKPFVQGRLVVLFGCAGMRERSKRAEMADAVLRYADVVFLSSDNPREERQAQIFEDVLPVLSAQKKIPYTVEADRRKAVCAAVKSLQAGDVLALCGKGHEDYQVLCGRSEFLDEKQLVEEMFLDDADTQP